MLKIPILYDSYQECILDLDIFGQVVSIARPDIAELREIYFEEFKRNKPWPTLENKRYELSRLVSDDYKIAYEQELDLQDNESLTDLGAEPVVIEHPDFSDLEPMVDEVTFVFQYEHQIDDNIRAEIVKKYDLMTGEEFEPGVRQTEKIVGSVKEDTSTVYSDSEIDNLGKEKEEEVNLHTGVEFADESDGLIISVNEEFVDLTAGLDLESETDSTVEAESVDEVDDYFSAYEDESEEPVKESEVENGTESESESADEVDDYSAYEETERSGEPADEVDDYFSAYEESEQPVEVKQEESQPVDEVDDYFSAYDDDAEVSEDSNVSTVQIQEQQVENTEDEEYDFSADEESTVQVQDQVEAQESDSDDEQSDYDDYDFEAEESGTAEVSSSVENTTPTVEEVKDAIRHVEQLSHKTETAATKSSSQLGKHSAEYVDPVEDIDLTKDDDIALAMQQLAEMSKHEEPKKEPVVNPVERSEQEPTDLRQFLRKHPRCDKAFALQYFTKKQIDDAIKRGTVVERQGKLRRV